MSTKGKAMGKVSKDSTAEPIEGPGFEGRYGETDGYTIGFERYTEHADMTPLFVGLPDDKCQSPHWGYVFKGKLVYHTADGDIEITDGEAYYVGAGHTPEIYPGTEIVEFSPTTDFQTTMDVVGKTWRRWARRCWRGAARTRGAPSSGSPSGGSQVGSVRRFPCDARCGWSTAGRPSRPPH